MLDVTWSILNVLLLVSFPFFLINVMKIIREKRGIILALFLSFLLFSFVFRKEKVDNNITRTSRFTTDSKDNIYPGKGVSDFKKLEEMPLSDVELYSFWGFSKEKNEYIPIDATVSFSGFTSGHQWKTSHISIDKEAAKSGYEYTITGSVEWSILGFSVYTQPKQFTGKLATPKGK